MPLYPFPLFKEIIDICIHSFTDIVKYFIMTQGIATDIFHPLSNYSICDHLGSENQYDARKFEHIALPPGFFKSGNESWEKASGFSWGHTAGKNLELELHSAKVIHLMTHQASGSEDKGYSPTSSGTYRTQGQNWPSCIAPKPSRAPEMWTDGRNSFGGRHLGSTFPNQMHSCILTLIS